MDIIKNISTNLSSWMDASKELNTIENVEKISGVSYSTIQRIKSGTAQVPKIISVYRIARAFGKTIDEIIAAPSKYTNVVSLEVKESTPPIYSPIAQEIIDMLETMDVRGQYELIGEARMLARLYPRQKNSAAQ